MHTTIMPTSTMNSQPQPGRPASMQGFDDMTPLSHVSIIAAVFLPVGVSIIACAIAIAKSFRGKRDLPSRIASYIMMSSLGFGFVQVLHQIMVLTSANSDSATTALAAAAFFFLVYVMLSQLYLTLVTYLRIRWQVRLELGLFDWYLHLPCAATASILGLLFYSYDGLGALGLLCLSSSSPNGYMVTLSIAVLALINSVAALACRRSISADLDEANIHVQTAESDFYQASSIFSTKSQDHTSFKANKSHLAQEPVLDSQTARLRDRWIVQLNDMGISTRLASMVTVSVFIFAPIFVSSLAVSVVQGFGMVDLAANVLITVILNSLAAGNAVGFLYSCRQATRTVSDDDVA
ncbi:hypothetical protein BCR44DRAFT_79173 [Catenaria anguillulae PL171]|uniref:G-protein coupled receptors family 1 profile domain-containing protein n=1 Tax=Catenaria anguillulae PL171 TaxID=765915 RepID=A0A1Y2HGJ3_9FUNG|nr:hypothetical protein BCR44DRAFT_79173 [Catenaria anguillulae PL171]